MDSTPFGRFSFVLCCLAPAPARAAVLCAAPARPESRALAFNANRHFLRGGAELSPTGRSQLAAYVEQRDPASPAELAGGAAALVIEAVAHWRQHSAHRRGAICVAQA